MRVIGLNSNLQREKNIQSGSITCNRAIGVLNDHRVVPVIRRVDRLDGQRLGGAAINSHAIMLPLVRKRSRTAGRNGEYRAPALLHGLARRLSRDPRRKVHHQRRGITRHRADRVGQDCMIVALLGNADTAYLQRRLGSAVHGGSIVIPLITDRIGAIGNHTKNNKGPCNHRLRLRLLSHRQRRQNQNINRLAVRDAGLVGHLDGVAALIRQLQAGKIQYRLGLSFQDNTVLPPLVGNSAGTNRLNAQRNIATNRHRNPCRLSLDKRGRDDCNGSGRTGDRARRVGDRHMVAASITRGCSRNGIKRTGCAANGLAILLPLVNKILPGR